MKKNKKVYYIGFNANNAICNESFFEGSITLYPTGEKGNIYYSKKIVDRNSVDFEKNYKEFIYKNAKKIQFDNNSNVEFICFNDKIREICSDFSDIYFVNSNDESLLKFINDKFAIRDYLNNYFDIPLLEYENNINIDYDELVKKYKTKKFVLQEKNGAGGSTTYYVKNKEEYNKIKINNNECCISKYIKNTPLNITLIISKKDIIYLPVSVQLIKIIDNKFKYVGGDFAYTNNLDINLIQTINKYSSTIGLDLQKKGYRGVLGIDYILSGNKIYFMEINPRFQSSSFLISKCLYKYYNTTVAELNYLSLNNKSLPKIDIRRINKSFLNCNEFQSFENYKCDEAIFNGYFDKNLSSFYRKIFNDSIINSIDFEYEV